MKVLHINCVYPTGSTGKITSELHHALKREGHESIVLYSRGKKVIEPDAIQVCSDFWGKLNHSISRLTGLMYGGCTIQTQKILRIIKQEKPDLVHLQCINGYFVNIYRLVSFLSEARIPTVLTLHAEFMYTANCGCSFECEKWKEGCGHCPKRYWATESYFFDRTHESFLQMQRAFRGFENRLTVVGVSEWLSNRAKESPIMKDCEIRKIYNGIDTSVFAPVEANKVRSDLGVSSDEKLVLWVTSGYTKEKGEDFFLQLSASMRGSEYRFVVVGTERPADYEGDVLFVGRTANQKTLAEFYSAADVSLCCSRQESYPTVCLESQSCGTPVVGFDVGGVAETIFPGMGEVVPLGNIEHMGRAVEWWAEEKKKLSADTLRVCRDYVSSERMKQEYLDLYQAMLGI